MSPSRGLGAFYFSLSQSASICARCRLKQSVTISFQRRMHTMTAGNISSKPPKPILKPPADPAARPSPSISYSASSLPTTFSTYTQTQAPTLDQLKYASRFFTRQDPAFLFSASHFRTLPLSAVPEVAFLGRSNVGKSSLLNALLHRSAARLAHVSKRPGRTRTMNAFGVGGAGGGVKKAVGGVGERERWIGPGGVVVLDMPGYGKGSNTDWGKEVTKYLSSRKQLRRVFLLIDSSVGPKLNDETFLRLLHQTGIQFQVVLSKVDKILWPKAKTSLDGQKLKSRMPKLDLVVRKVQDMILATGNQSGRWGLDPPDILAFSSNRNLPAPRGYGVDKLGVDDVRWAVLTAAGLESDNQGRQRKVDLDIIKEDGDIVGNEPAAEQPTGLKSPVAV